MPDVNQTPADAWKQAESAALSGASDAKPNETRSTAAPQPPDAAQLAPLQEEIALLKDQLLRAQADVSNTRRRAEEDVAKARKFAIESFAESLLAVVDSLEAALAVETASAEQLREGTEATHRQLMSTLERNQVLQVNPARGERFDPNRQHAITTVPTSGAQEPNTVVDVLQKGYVIADRVLRPALVIVTQSG